MKLTEQKNHQTHFIANGNESKKYEMHGLQETVSDWGSNVSTIRLTGGCGLDSSGML